MASSRGMSASATSSDQRPPRDKLAASSILSGGIRRRSSFLKPPRNLGVGTKTVMPRRSASAFEADNCRSALVARTALHAPNPTSARAGIATIPDRPELSRSAVVGWLLQNALSSFEFDRLGNDLDCAKFAGASLRQGWPKLQCHRGSWTLQRRDSFTIRFYGLLTGADRRGVCHMAAGIVGR